MKKAKKRRMSTTVAFFGRSLSNVTILKLITIYFKNHKKNSNSSKHTSSEEDQETLN